MAGKRARLNAGELAIVGAGIAAFAILVAFQLGLARGSARSVVPVPPSEIPDRNFAHHLEETYGPDRNSEDLEEWIIRDFFQDERDGVFVDVGANHHQERSNTYYLETRLGWSGLAIEPQVRFAVGYERFRQRTIFIPLFVSDASNENAILYVPKTNHLVASATRDFAGLYEEEIVPTPTTTTTLDDALDRSGITGVDFLSMDIELGEPKALAGFSISRFRPRLICIEAHAGARQQILEYFHRNGYVLIGQYLGVDDDNYWFAPLGGARPETGHFGH